jgi:CRP/FNR family cyclic AMP-dependent transcriptional regulator
MRARGPRTQTTLLNGHTVRIARVAMRIEKKWAEQFTRVCAQVPSARRRSLTSGEMIYAAWPEGRCWVVAAGYVKLIDLRPDGDRFIRLIHGRGGLFGDRPFRSEAFRGFAAAQCEQAVAHGPAEVVEVGRVELEDAALAQSVLATLLIESASVRAEFIERRLLWQCTSPIRARVAAALRDLICYEGDRCRHGHTIDVRLSHQDLAELVGAARPVVSAELVQMRREGLVEYTRCYFCVDDLDGLNRVAVG